MRLHGVLILFAEMSPSAKASLKKRVRKRKKNTEVPETSAATVGYEAEVRRMADAALWVEPQELLARLLEVATEQGLGARVRGCVLEEVVPL